MFYYLFDYLQQCCDFPGAGLFEYISFRAAMAVITSLIITLLFGKRWIRFLNRKQVGETIRNLGLEGQMEVIDLVELVDRHLSRDPGL